MFRSSSLRWFQTQVVVPIKYNCKLQTQICISCLIQKKLQGITESTRIRRMAQNSIFTVYDIMPKKIRKDQQSITRWTITRASSHCLWGYIYIFSKHDIPSQASTLTNITCPFIKQFSGKHVSASRKHFLIRQIPEKHTMAQLILQRNEKFLVHIPISVLKKSFP